MVLDSSSASWNPTPNYTMSDTEEITRKIPGGSKITEKIKKAIEGDGEPDGEQVEHVVKKRKLDEIPAEYEHRS